jgi:hypothetical protein
MNKICPACKIEFNRKYNNQKYCSDLCSKEVNKEGKKKWWGTHKQQKKQLDKIYRETHKVEKRKSDRDYYLKNKEKILEYRKKYLIRNKEKISKQLKIYYQNHKEEIRIYKSEYYQKNKQELSQQYKIYRETHKEQRKEYLRTHKKQIRKNVNNRRKIDINFKIRNYLATRIWKVLNGIYKSNRTMKLVGCNIEQLKQHLESQFKLGMSWNNYGKWHIDHIKPCVSFDLSKSKEQARCFHYTNLQPLWAKENLIKSAKY